MSKLFKPAASTSYILHRMFLAMVVTILAVSFESCKKDPNITNKTTVKDIYVAGIEGDQVKVWKNGTVNFSMNLTTEKAGVGCMYFSDGILYVGGTRYTSSKNVAVVWKNGVATELTDGTVDEIIIDISIASGNVYAITASGKLFKNNELDTNLVNAGIMLSTIFATGSNVYFTAKVNSNIDSNTYLSLYKNGEIEYILDKYRYNPPTMKPTSTNPYSLFVFNNDTYVGGSYYSPNGMTSRFLKKNGVDISLNTSESYQSSVSFVTASATNFYVTHQAFKFNSGIPKVVVKNGNEDTTLFDTKGSPNFVLLDSTDVYVTGSKDSFAMYCKNGIPTLLTDGSKRAAAITMYVK